jgi:hypothetical protein
MPHPIQKTEKLVAEAERGQSGRTPLIVLGGVNVIVALIVAVMLAIVFTVYLLA